MKRLWITTFLHLLFFATVTSCATAGAQRYPTMDETIIEDIRSIQSKGDMPSIQIAVIKANEIIFNGTMGQTIDKNSVYMNGSVQKMFDATAILQLTDRGLIDLDDDINSYLPFTVKHPGYPEIAITFRMLLSHRSGLDSLPNQFAWDTACSFHPDLRNDCKPGLAALSLEEFLTESFSPEGAYYSPEAWKYKPGEEYHYSVSAFPLIHLLIEYISGIPYPDYMEENIFNPLEMTNSGFYSSDFPTQNAIPTTRIDGENIDLAPWDGNGYLMRTTAKDMAAFILALMNEGTLNEYQLLEPETVKLMRSKTSRFDQKLFSNQTLKETGYGYGLIHYTHGFVGHGGSTVGYQTLLQFNPSIKSGFVITTNTNGILGSKEDFLSVWDQVALVRDLLFSQTNPFYNIHLAPGTVIYIIAVLVFLSNFIRILIIKKRKRIESLS